MVLVPGNTCSRDRPVSSRCTGDGGPVRVPAVDRHLDHGRLELPRVRVDLLPGTTRDERRLPVGVNHPFADHLLSSLTVAEQLVSVQTCP